MTKFYKLMLEANREEEADIPPEPFSQICPGGGIFQLSHSSAPLGKRAGGKVVLIQGLTDRGCPSECEKKMARSTYFCKKTAIDVCPLPLATK